MNEDFKCRYCGLVFDNRKLLKEHIERECVGKVIYQKTTIMGRLEKFFEKIKHERDVYDIKKGMEVLRKMEELRKEGKIPVIKIRDSKELEELKKVINFRGEVVYLSNVSEELINEIIDLKPKAVVGEFSEREKEILESSGISILPENRVSMIDGTCGYLMEEVHEEEEEVKIEEEKEENIEVGEEEEVEEEAEEEFDVDKLPVTTIESKLKKPKEMKIVEAPKETEVSVSKKIQESGHKAMKELNLVNLKEEFFGEKKNLIPGLMKKRERTLREVALENLSKTREIEDYRKATLLIAHLIKQFLEIKLNCPEDLSYAELIGKLKTSYLPIDYLDDVMQFFKDIHIQEYRGEVRVSFQEAYKLAEQLINDLA